ncbi:MAG: pseudouridine synthase [Chitinophagaceae bacterium]
MMYNKANTPKKNKPLILSSSSKTKDVFDKEVRPYNTPKSIQKHSKIKTLQSPVSISKTSSLGEQMPLNKYLAHCGICSRRDAAEHIKNGLVEVNNKQETNPAYKVQKQDVVQYKSKPIQLEKKGIYILINKPKNCLCTVEDTNERKTVLDLIPEHTQDRIYPIGRLDRNTTGVLLLTNDGNLTQKLTHPSYKVKKIYHIKLNKPVTKKDFETLLQGIELEDGHIAPDFMAYQDNDKTQIGIEIHSGRNRIVRRIFEHLGYEVKNLDRVMFGDFTKKDVSRGKWRYLNEQEIRRLKIFYKNFKK